MHVHLQAHVPKSALIQYEEIHTSSEVDSCQIPGMPNEFTVRPKYT